LFSQLIDSLLLPVIEFRERTRVSRENVVTEESVDTVWVATMQWSPDLDEVLQKSRPSVALQSAASVLEIHISAMTVFRNSMTL